MKIKDIIKSLEGLKDEKSRELMTLCEQCVVLDEFINFDQNNVAFPEKDAKISMKQAITDAFLSKLASIEFGYNGWIFAGGSHKSIAESVVVEAKKFGEMYGRRFGEAIPLAAGATSSFMEIINQGYNKSGHYAITSTTRFPGVHNKVNKEVKYCFTASTFANMEIFLIHNSIGGVFFEGGAGTAYEAFSMLIERQRNALCNKNAPIIFIKTNEENHLLNDTLKKMLDNGKARPADLHNVYSVDTSEEAIDILVSSEALSNAMEAKDVKNEVIREIFAISKDRYI